MDFSWKVMQILDISVDEYYDNMDRIEKENHILS